MIARGQAADLEERLARASNVVDTIGKPFSPEALQAVVARVVRLPGSLGRTATSFAVAEALSLSAEPADSGAAEARAFAADGLLLAGNLASISLSQIIELLGRSAAHGDPARRQTPRPAPASRSIFRRGGSTSPRRWAWPRSSSIGRFTVETGDIAAEALTRVLEERAGATVPPPLFGADLNWPGGSSRRKRSRWRSPRQTSELAYETLRWRAGFFQFRYVAELPAAAREARLSTQRRSDAAAGHCWLDEWRVIEAPDRRPGRDLRPQRKQDRPAAARDADARRARRARRDRQPPERARDRPKAADGYPSTSRGSSSASAAPG